MWWHIFAPAVKTFLAQCDLSGKEVRPFATNGGWLGKTFQNIAAACPGAAAKKGLNAALNENRLARPELEIRTWAEQIKKT